MEKIKPFIGVVSNYRSAQQEYFLPEAYIEALAGEGGNAIILPYAPQGDVNHFVCMVDGLVLTGGTDFAPELYGGRHHPAMSEILANRDTFEFALARAALASGKPLLTICRGMQLINVLRGGTIFDHTLDDRQHPSYDHRDGTALSELVHDVELAEGSRLRAICGPSRMKVNSMHHQAIDRLGEGLVVAARAPDGVVEAVEDPGHPFLFGLQWHPEQRQQDDFNRRIIRAFVEACRTANRCAGSALMQTR